MATVVGLVATYNTTTGTHTATGTSVTGDLIVIFVANSATTATPTVTDDDGGTYTLIGTGALYNASADKMFVFVRDALVAAGKSTIYSATGASSTGGGLFVHRVTGMSRAGASAARQSAKQENQAAGTPAPVLGAAALTANPLLCGVGTLTNGSANCAPRVTPAWAETFDQGYSATVHGFECQKINSGETGTTLTLGAATPSAFACIAVELDSSLPAINATGASTLPSLTQAAEGDVIANATGAQTFSALTQAAESDAVTAATAASALGALTQAAEGDVLALADGASAIGALTQAAALAALTAATGAQMLPALEQAATGTVQDVGQINATGASTLPLATQAADAAALVAAAAASALVALVQAAEADLIAQGVASSTLAALEQGGTGALQIGAAGASFLPSLEQAALGHVDDGSVNANGATLLPVLVGVATGTAPGARPPSGPTRVSRGAGNDVTGGIGMATSTRGAGNDVEV